MRKIVLLFTAIMSSLLVNAQERKVTGKISDPTGTPVIGASILTKGTRAGTSSDANGNFSLVLPGNSKVLIVSAIGFEQQEVNVATRTTITVILKQDKAHELGEVIVTGVAGATTKEKMTVSVTKISFDRINAVPATSLSAALTGKVAGVKATSLGGLPGEALDIQLRADNNLNHVGSGPLIIVDGIQISGSLADINADDVESMEIVKGAAASALYGSRAGNGVISVITKRGKSGAVNVMVRNEVGFQNLAHELKVAKHHGYALASDWESFKDQYTKYAGVTYPAGYVGAGYHPGIVGNRGLDADHYMDNTYGIERNQQKEFFGTGINYTNFISFGTKSDKTGIYASFENNVQQGIVKLTDGYKRQNFRINIDQQIFSWLKVSASNLFINKTVQTPSGGGLFYDIARMEPDVNLNAVNPVDNQPYYPRVNQFNGEVSNPLYLLSKEEKEDKTKRWLGNYSANIKFTTWVNLDIAHAIEIENSRYTQINPKDTWKTSGGTAATYGMAYTDGSMNKRSGERISQNTQATLNMSTRFSEFSVRGKLSYLYESRDFEQYSVSASKFKVNGIQNLNNFETISSASSLISQERAQNYFAIASVDYKGRYLLDGMFRYDGSSLFGPEARWNPYYRVSGAYRISEDFAIKGIEELKIRAAHGTAGIRPGFDWQYETYSLSNGIATARQQGNEFLKPSRTSETEIGLNVNFLKKFTFEATYARSETKDQFLNVKLIPFLSGGFAQQWQNAGSVKSNTLELTFGANWLNKPNLSWSTNIVFSRIRQNITDLPIPPYAYTDQSQGDQSLFYVKSNETYGVMYGFRFVKTLDEMSRQLPTGKSISDYIVNSDGYVIAAGTEGKIAERPIKYRENDADWYGKIGDGNADFNMGISNTIRHKGFSLYFLLDWKQGGDIYNGKAQRLAFNNIYYKQDMYNVPFEKKKASDYWTAGLYDANFGNKYWVEDGSYLKLREIALGYTFTTKSLSNLFHGAIKEITAKLIGRNLYTITKYTGYDPEVGSIRQPYDGIYMNPNYRNIAFSLSVNF